MMNLGRDWDSTGQGERTDRTRMEYLRLALKMISSRTIIIVGSGHIL